MHDIAAAAGLPAVESASGLMLQDPAANGIMFTLAAQHEK